MKVTITYSDDCNDIGKGWSSTFSSEGVEYLEDLLYVFGRSAVGAGFSLDRLQGEYDYTETSTGLNKTATFRSEF